jgi:transposase-like protein
MVEVLLEDDQRGGSVMDTRSFEGFLSLLKFLSPRQCEKVRTRLVRMASRDQAADIIEKVAHEYLACPDCGGKHIYRHGKVSGMQRYRCRACNRTFNALSGTPLAHLRLKSCWLDFLDCMLDPATTVRSAAASVGVHKNTSFRWRHRFLTISKTDRPNCLHGIAEADELYLLESEKGSRKLTRPARHRGGAATKRGISDEQICVVVARDRSGQTLDFVTGRGPVTKAQLKSCLPPVLDRDVLLVSDSNAAYRYFARDERITHHAINLRAGIRVNGAIHVQNVNAYHSRFRGWLRHFNGVATHYLTNYLGWRWAIDAKRIDASDTFLRAAIGVFHN